MREIKFRAWHTEAKEMLYEDRLGDVLSWKQQGQPVEVMQYTGLKDKNGNEIYEGDILRYTFDGVTKINVIEFQPPIFTYRDSMRWSLDQDKVIGNIYENPELLGEI